MTTPYKTCPFCHCLMGIHAMDTLDYHECNNRACQYKSLARYSCNIDHSGKLMTEQIILTDKLYVSVYHHQDETQVSRMDEEMLLSDTVIFRKALKLDMTDIAKVINKIKVLLLFS